MICITRTHSFAHALKLMQHTSRLPTNQRFQATLARIYVSKLDNISAVELYVYVNTI